MCAIKNRKAIEQSLTCGCFKCLAIFPTTEVNCWTDNEQTAICPHCNQDSLLTSFCGTTIDKENLKVINTYWFGA